MEAIEATRRRQRDKEEDLGLRCDAARPTLTPGLVYGGPQVRDHMPTGGNRIGPAHYSRPTPNREILVTRKMRGFCAGAPLVGCTF